MRHIVASIALALLLACGPRTEGSGVARTETRKVGAFSDIVASSGIDVAVHVGGALSVEVAGDDNIVALVETEVSGERLRVGFKSGRNIHAVTPVHVEIVAPALRQLSASSGSHVKASGAAADAFEIDASSGANVDAGELTTRSASIHASSGANVTVRAADAARGEASSGANVTVLGHPGARSISTSSGANVRYP